MRVTRPIIPLTSLAIPTRQLVSRPSRPVLLKPLLSPCIAVAPLKSMVRREDRWSTTNSTPKTSKLPAVPSARVGAHRPRPPARFPVTLPAPGTPVPSVAALVADAHALAQENRAPRAQYELVSVNNTGLAAHASVFHDRNLALLHRTREGYQAGMVMLEQALLSRARTEQANVDLEDRVRGLRDQAGRVDAAETQLRVFKASSVEDYHALQDQLAASQAEVADLSARLAAVPPVPAPPSTSTVSMARLSPVESDNVTAPSPNVTKHVGISLRSSRSVTQSSGSAIRLGRCPSLWSKVVTLQSVSATKHVKLRRELNSSATLWLRICASLVTRLLKVELRLSLPLNDPLQADVRRVNALLVTHAEALQRETDRIRELEETAAAASTARVVAEAETARAQANELQAASRSGQYRTGWLAMWRRSLQRRDAAGAHIRRLSVRVADLDDERDLAVRERDERAVAWRRMLRDARRGRELAQRVRDDLAGKLANSVSSVGGTIDTADLIRRLEATYAAEVDAAIPLPPADLARATPVAVSVASPPVVVAGSSASAPSSGTVPSPSVSAQRLSSSVAKTPPFAEPFFPLAFFAAFTFSIDFASALPFALGVAFGVAFPLGFAFIVAFLVALVGSLRRLGELRGVGCFRSLDPLASAGVTFAVGTFSHAKLVRRFTPAGLMTDSSSPSSARPSSSSSVSSGSEGAAPVVPFFVPRGYFPWPKSVRRLRLHTITARELRARFLPPRGWICPRAPVPEPANWNRALVTRANVDALYATRPWRYLAQEVESVLFASDDAAFQPFMRPSSAGHRRTGGLLTSSMCLALRGGRDVRLATPVGRTQATT
ncbi:hypothetical protein PHYSODRAFT_246140 [Phytophthora sojae]|uniref:Uncharacterized protein n=1 Tax=Phytophthora sojae (strain P6497) TaxID=1094619 RepID=G4YWN6_PHYSP|nr:hypothetical protein PHYSODRAFT_246140 [Phytophthora sojae]EGZ23217.1 hypothetical protein PHYSODRAFT_246140 [Phytophthora sojae]|eukprot:XP_009518505.1 hypothetical protein PHYSODRAFT_246140 [Phytophthora sojae]